MRKSLKSKTSPTAGVIVEVLNPAARKVLVCDDNESILDVLEAVLTEFGYQVITCSDGTKVPELVLAENPDIVMLDVWMPKADGRVVLKQIKQQSDIPVILISALNGLAEIAEKSGADGYLEKPFEITNVISVIEEHLPKFLAISNE